jgi:penicillin amidase
MSVYASPDDEPRLATRRNEEDRAPFRQLHPHDPAYVAASLPPAPSGDSVRPPRADWARPRNLLVSAVLLGVIVAVTGSTIFFVARHWVRSAAYDSLPRIDGSLTVAGLSAPVSVQRDAQGVPHIRAQSLDDLVFAEAFVTAQDRLFQMDTLRRHAAGELAEILGPTLIEHDKIQRTLQIRAAADRAVAALPPDQLHLLEVYARGVNALIAQQSAHLPVEFRVLRYTPKPWTPRDSVLVQLVMFQDLTNQYTAKLAREALTAQFGKSGSQALVPDLYPSGSWRDHPPAEPQPDLTLPGPPIEEVPLDESQASLTFPVNGQRTTDNCFSCFPGSNNWVVSGAHTASGKPLLSNDMHLTHSLPGIWYEADLEAPIPGSEPLHVAGVSIPGLPLIVVGHNAHVAWGFTNVGADVQDLYLETTRGSGQSEEFQTVSGTWQPVIHLPETIKVSHAKDIAWDVAATRHGDTITPILTPILRDQSRQVSLRWTLYDPSVVQLPVYAFATAHDWPSFLTAVALFGGPAQNIVYADDQGHIGYHASGRIPLRGAAPATPPPAASTNDPGNPEAAAAEQAATAPGNLPLSGPLSAVPVVPSAATEWSGYIPFDRLPQVFDPPSGVIATANGRVAPDGYPYPITLNWGEAYRTERLYHLLLHSKGLTPHDMLATQTDIYSDFDHVLAQRLAYALDHSPAIAVDKNAKHVQTLRQAADLLRNFDGRMTTDSAAASIVTATHSALWPMLLAPHLNAPAKGQPDPLELYAWYAKDFALEEIVTHQEPRWLPKQFSNWNDFLASAVALGLAEAKAPSDLAKWQYGSIHTVDIEHPIFEQSAALRTLLGRPTGTGVRPQSGDGTTVKQVGHTFGPSERFTADFSNFDNSTLNVVLGQSGNPDSQWFMDQFPAWYRGTTHPLPFSDAAVNSAAQHKLVLTPK